MLSLTASIVSHFSDPRLLQVTLASLTASIDAAATTHGIREAAVFLVDNTGSEAEHARIEALASAHSTALISVTLLKAGENRGYGAANNFAIACSRSDFHLVLNPDVELLPDCIDSLLDCMNTHPEAVLLAPFATNRQRTPLRLARARPGLLTLLGRALPLSDSVRDKLGNAAYELRDALARAGDQPSPVPLASGCFMFCRSEALRKCGGFDERYFMYFEDYDLSLRIARAGLVMHCPSARIVHEGGGAARKGIRHIAWFARSAIRFWRAHGFRWVAG